MTGQIVSAIERLAIARDKQVSFGILTIAWGIFLLLPFAVFQSSIGYRALASVAPEWAWGALMLVIGVVSVWFRDRPTVTRIALALSFSIWSFIAAGFVFSNWASTAGVSYTWVAVQYGILFWHWTWGGARWHWTWGGAR